MQSPEIASSNQLRKSRNRRKLNVTLVSAGVCFGIRTIYWLSKGFTRPLTPCADSHFLHPGSSNTFVPPWSSFTGYVPEK